jgi:hypothetical protein
MKITGSKLTVESFPEQNSWVGKLLSPLNQFIGEVVLGFNNGLSIDDNLFQELKEVKFVNSSGNFPIKFALKFSQLPKAVQIVYCYNETDGTTQAITTLPVWSYSNGQISISSITGTTSGKSYIIRVHVIYS